MNWRRCCPWIWLRRATHTDEARELLALMHERGREVRPLGAELREQLRRNHFSEMVAVAIQRRRRDG